MSEEKQKSGIIQAVSIKEEKKMFSFKIDNWYTGQIFKFKDQYKTLAKGDKVDFSYEENEAYGKVFNNIVPGKLKIEKGKPSEFKQAGENTYAQRDNEKREDILRSVAVKGSLELMNHLMNNAGDSDEIQTKRVLKIADKILIWLKNEKTIKQDVEAKVEL